MSKAGISFEEMKTDMLKDEEFKIEYEKLKPRYEAIEQIIILVWISLQKWQNHLGKKYL